MTGEMMKSFGVRFPDRFAQWPVTRAMLAKAIKNGEAGKAELMAFNAAKRAYTSILTKQRADRRNTKLHVGVAVVTEDGKVVGAHNNADEHAEDGVLRGLLFHYESLSESESLPRIAAVALVGVHANTELHGEDAEWPDELDADALPKGLPTPCYKCLYKIHRAVKDIAESRMKQGAPSSKLNFPILVTSTEGQAILRTDFKTIASLPWSGTSFAKSFAAVVENGSH